MPLFISDIIELADLCEFLEMFESNGNIVVILCEGWCCSCLFWVIGSTMYLHFSMLFGNLVDQMLWWLLFWPIFGCALIKSWYYGNTPWTNRTKCQNSDDYGLVYTDEKIQLKLMEFDHEETNVGD